MMLAPSPLPAATPLAQSRTQAGAATYAATLARLAVRSLYAELALYPKPGLVSLIDNGSHEDMDATTFLRSLFSLRHYFYRISLAGMDDASFAHLKQLGIGAEAAMMRATGGINTHRGAIFSLGLLCAAAGTMHAQGATPDAATLRATMLSQWGSALAAHATPNASTLAEAPHASRTARTVFADAPAAMSLTAAPEAAAAMSHGLRVAAMHATSGAREEGARGLPSVFEIGLPALQAALSRGASVVEARIETLFSLMAHISDTNIYHRAGPQGAQLVRDRAQRFIALGGTQNPSWYAEAADCHRLFVQHRLSPGGAADLLAASCFLHAIVHHGQNAP